MNKSYLSDAIDPPAPKAVDFIHEPSHYNYLEEERALHLEKAWYDGKGTRIIDKRYYQRAREIRLEKNLFNEGFGEQ